MASPRASHHLTAQEDGGLKIKFWEPHGDEREKYKTAVITVLVAPAKMTSDAIGPAMIGGAHALAARIRPDSVTVTTTDSATETGAAMATVAPTVAAEVGTAGPTGPQTGARTTIIVAGAAT